MAWNEKTRAISAINRKLKKVCKQVSLDIREELKQAYDESLELWWDKFLKWTKHKQQVPGFDFLRKASSGYGSNTVDPQLSDGNYEATLSIDPTRMHAGLKHQWGDHKGESFSDQDAFDMMYIKGVYGFNKEIVSESWYNTPKSIEKYIARTGAPKDTTKEDIINKLLKKKKFIPPIKRTSPEKIMKSKAKKILDRNHVEDVMRKYLNDADLFNTQKK